MYAQHGLHLTWTGIEYGFSSTTRDRTTAEFYAKVKVSDMASTLIEVQMGSIRCGA